VTTNGASEVTLVVVDELLLEELVEVALSQALADEVTPPLTAGNTWTRERVDWLKEFHRQRRGGFKGPLKEATWAVVEKGIVVGSVRLKTTAAAGTFETGLWLARGARGRGLGHQALSAVLAKAVESGAEKVQADTAPENRAALGLLRSAGFATAVEHGRIHATLELPGPQPPSST
jgi:RimJ/RimL family protein N-acetyltransferase